MNKKDNDISVEEIMDEIKSRVKAKNSKLYNQTFFKNNSNDFEIKRIYTYQDFLKYNGTEFISNIFKALLGRDVDQKALTTYLRMLKSGVKTKMEIITLIRFSKEGRKNAVKLLGYKKRLLVTLFLNVPYLSYFTRSIFFLIRIPIFIKKINKFENNLNNLSNNIGSLKTDTKNSIKSLETDTKNSIKSFKEEISNSVEKFTINVRDSLSLLDQEMDEKASRYDTVELYRDLKKQKVNILSTLHKFDSLMTKIEKGLSIEHGVEKEKLVDLNQLKNESKFDYLYKPFEDKFRGSEEDIKDKLSVYLPFLNKYEQKEEVNILDIGCGRGEWLSLLKTKGFNVKGVDMNAQMVEHAKDLGLNVKLTDALSYLKSLDDGSLDVISGFHIIEHVAFDEVLGLLEQCLRVLKSEGIIIFETPNPRNILVGASDFYMDPTHKNPIHPMSLKFFADKIGFDNTKILFLREKEFTPMQDVRFSTLDDFVTVGRDYALVGYKI